MWDAKAQTDNYFTQTGRGNSFTMYQFLLFIQDVNNSLKLCKTDSLLDAGGGPGWTAFHLAPFVSEVTMFDYSREMVRKAQEQAKAFGNVTVFQDDILTMASVKGPYSKVLVGSVLQYLTDTDEVKQVLRNVYRVMEPGGVALFTYNPDLSKKESHIASMPQTAGSLRQENERLWIDPQQMMYASLKAGFRSCRKLSINPQIWQNGHMFDFVIVK
jgi:SAM-dependent methyltransferase